MKDKEMAEEYVDTLLDKDDAELDKFLDEYLGDLRLTKKQAGAILGIIKGVGIGSYLAGLEACRPKWHKVADGDLPNTETKDYTYIRRRKRYERQFTDYRVIKCFVLCQNEKGKITAEVGYFDCNKKCFLNNAEGIVIAWKEIVFPKESE